MNECKSGTGPNATNQISMKKQTKTEPAIFIDAESTGRKPEGLVEAWCPECGELVNGVTAEAAAVLSDLDLLTVKSRIVAGDIHCPETADGLRLVCLNSLLK